MSVEAPLAPAEVDAAFGVLGGAGGVALAVSGGADSVALMLAAASWRGRSAPDLPLRVFTVDHALRPGSQDEAARVVAWAEALDLPARVLVARGGAPRSNIQAWAREARYALLIDAALDAGLTHIATAHHLDDQAETLLLRLARGSGLKGLAAMAPLTRLPGGLHLARRFLHVPKTRLAATCRAAGHPWIEDASNADDRFARARMRKLMPALAAQGLTAKRLGETAQRLARAQQAVDEMVDRLLATAFAVEADGRGTFLRAALAAAPGEVALRALARALLVIGEADRPPRLERLESLLDALLQGQNVRRTLGHCKLAADEARVSISREAPRREPRPADAAAAKPHPSLTLPRAQLGKGGRHPYLSPRAEQGV